MDVSILGHTKRTFQNSQSLQIVPAKYINWNLIFGMLQNTNFPMWKNESLMTLTEIELDHYITDLGQM